MKKLLKKLFIFICLFLSLCALWCLFFFTIVAPQYSKSYSASLWNKVDRLRSIDEPKIVLLGDSNVAFGFRSDIIEKATGMPVVNMGLQNGFGNAFLENLSKLNVHEGDIYVICHDSFSDDGRFTDPSLVWITFENNFKLIPLLTKEQFLQLPPALPYYMRNALALWFSGRGNQEATDVYTLSSFNEYGDISYERNETTCSFSEPVVPEINDICINRINELNAHLTSRGATLVVAGFPIPCENPAAYSDAFDSFQEELESRLDCPVISDYKDYLYPYEYFYDSGLHLTNKGARKRSLQMISDFCQFID